MALACRYTGSHLCASPSRRPCHEAKRPAAQKSNGSDYEHSHTASGLRPCGFLGHKRPI
ncbi:hypothetical protein BOSE62_130389 [Bosea sp. 62]|nr:hypothetical protein BOSE7B_120397 [Bosea sp. 7B]CAD5277668.1 hypothetical protein BOSE21B_30517 [Bosea sp. 21B]CAD5278702.1 hypothetical protein BOSE46_40161 [Bosea sp. 46]VVT59744.1 hypothetical protein BOS5A_210535 [Bosea sp. EC-HK365B]VXB41686.1 hypothetical protein BOSE62_130389 [Bosea sp. 62]VXC03107.1 hypothetical protein BOSE127_170035 [Bosea sp. 127]